jgi:hypothetical protein
MNGTSKYHRRSVLRGLLGGAAVSVGLPVLDCFLNTNGTAYASGEALPVCFGTWFYGLGLNPGFWEPKTVGKNYELRGALEVLKPYQNKLNLYTGLIAHIEGGMPHAVGPRVILTGESPPASGATVGLPSVDVLISDVIGRHTRFRSLEASCDGSSRTSYSQRGGTGINPAEISPAALYTRLFGPDFKDPNATEFAPDVRVMVERSALSAVSEERQDFVKRLGSADRTRMDQYFTSLREIEQQLDIQLQKPAPMLACSRPNKPPETATGTDIRDALANHKLFANLIAHALACGQTQVFNLLTSGGFSNLRRPGNSSTHHIFTHEEVIDEKLGYQPNVAWFQDRLMEAFAEMLATLSSIREGDQTLLDRTVVFASTDVSYGRTHSMRNYPLMTAGSAGGRMKTGVHVSAPGDTVARLGLTLQQVMGVNAGSWGTAANQTSKPFTEVMV